MTKGGRRETRGGKTKKNGKRERGKTRGCRRGNERKVNGEKVDKERTKERRENRINWESKRIKRE